MDKLGFRDVTLAIRAGEGFPGTCNTARVTRSPNPACMEQAVTYISQETHDNHNMVSRERVQGHTRSSSKRLTAQPLT